MTELPDENPTSFESVRINVAKDIKKSWQDLTKNTLFTVPVNSYYCSDYDTIIGKIISSL